MKLKYNFLNKPLLLLIFNTLFNYINVMNNNNK